MHACALRTYTCLAARPGLLVPLGSSTLARSPLRFPHEHTETNQAMVCQQFFWFFFEGSFARNFVTTTER